MSAACGSASAQASLADLPHVAREMQLTFALPRIDELVFDTVIEQGFQPVDFEWRHRQGKFVLRYRLLRDTAASTTRPALAAGALAVHCADNAEGGYIGRWRAGTEDLERLGADWAYFWDYAPKADFSGYRRCYQASYYTEGLGLVHAWLLYNDDDLLHSDWVYVLPFARQMDSN